MVKLAMSFSCLKDLLGGLLRCTGDVTPRKYKHGPDKLLNSREMMIVIELLVNRPSINFTLMKFEMNCSI